MGEWRHTFTNSGWSSRLILFISFWFVWYKWSHLLFVQTLLLFTYDSGLFLLGVAADIRRETTLVIFKFAIPMVYSCCFFTAVRTSRGYRGGLFCSFRIRAGIFCCLLLISLMSWVISTITTMLRRCVWIPSFLTLLIHHSTEIYSYSSVRSNKYLSYPFPLATV